MGERQGLKDKKQKSKDKAKQPKVDPPAAVTPATINTKGGSASTPAKTKPKGG